MKDPTKRVIAVIIIIVGLIMIPMPIIPGIVIVALGYALWRDTDVQKSNKRK